MRSGIIDLALEAVRYVARDGRYWSSCGYSSDQAYGLYFNSGTVMDPSNDGFHYGARSLRCLSTV